MLTRSLKQALDLCVTKTRANIAALADAPGAWAWTVNVSYAEDPEPFFSIGNWTTSFHTGMALLGWRYTGDAFLLEQTQRLESWYAAKVCEHAADNMHDLGFLYSLYSVALYSITADTRHRDTGVRAAELLADRLITKAGCLQAWGRLDRHDPNFEGLVIIDSMMNLPLLYWAARISGRQQFHDVALRHAETVRRFLVRDDGSVFHAYRFDPATGKPRGGDNFCGHGIDSHWARGTAWAFYGFALSYRHARTESHLATARRLALRFVSEMDDEAVPVWDFRLPPDAERVRDSSAASVAICGIQELFTLGVRDQALASARERLLSRLCSPEYLDDQSTHAGLLKAGQIGEGIGLARNAYTSWGDYFFMQALSHELGGDISWW